MLEGLDVSMCSQDLGMVENIMAREHNREHINEDGEFQSDKYPWCRPGFVPLKLTDPMAQELLWLYAEKRISVDQTFSEDLKYALTELGYVAPAGLSLSVE